MNLSSFAPLLLKHLFFLNFLGLNSLYSLSVFLNSISSHSQKAQISILSDAFQTVSSATAVALCFVSIWMELSFEAYHLIVHYINNSDSETRLSDLLVLLLTSKTFKRVAERALYENMVLDSPKRILHACKTIIERRHLGELVLSLTIHATSRVKSFRSSAETIENAEDINVSSNDNDDFQSSVSSQGTEESGDFWPTVAIALGSLRRLRHLYIYIDSGDSKYAWVLGGHENRGRTMVDSGGIKNRYRLKTFHSDFTWDADLVKFLNEQEEIEDLYLADYRSPLVDNIGELIGEETKEFEEGRTEIPGDLRHGSLPALSTLECAFIEAISKLVPNRPVSRIKTCFSHEDVPGKIIELEQLCTALAKSSSDSIKSLDLADASYEEEFSMTVLREVVNIAPNLRYFGTLVLPVGFQRLRFYGMLRRLRALYAVELELSDWDPAPRTPRALRAIANEIRLYCPSIKHFVFVQDYDRTEIKVVNGFCVVCNSREDEGSKQGRSLIDRLWREVQSN